MEILNIFFYIILFAMGITFGSFYTLALYRIPKRQDITHTHSYCPNCNHKLGFLDLIPVFSYIFLGAKCRYCKQKIRPRYFIVEIVSGLLFVLFGFLLNLNIYNLEKIKIIDYAFFVLYFTFIILIAGIDKEFKNINKPVLMYGVIISIIYIVYLYIIDRTSIYRYVIYLLILAILLLIDTIILKKKAKNNYTLSILIMVIIMAIFTGEYIAINTVIVTLIAIALYLIIKKLNSKKSYKNTKLNNENICIGFYLRSCKYDMANRYTLLNFTKLLTERKLNMDFRSEKGVSGIDIVASVIIVTIFIAIIANIIANINLNSKDIEKKTQATSYAVDEIEIIKAEGYVDIYQDKGINQEDIILEEDINDENGKFSGYHKKISIKDYVLIKNDQTKQANIVKEITVEISYMNRKGTQNVQISTYVTKE